MVDDLYIFVDESGHHARGEHYTVASCWCLSNNSPQYVLDNARAELSKHISGTRGLGDVGELKGSQLPKDRLGTFLETLENFAYEDGTVADPPYPWQRNTPVQYSYHSLNPELGTRILSNYMSETDAPHVLQRLSLARILSPLTEADLVNTQEVDKIHLVPDAEVWKTPAENVCALLEELDGPEINVETGDSSRIPGIQIADLVAYSWRSYTKDGSCADAADHIVDRCLQNAT
ncbi:DUF3800 domain-containing protein [Halorussus salilacus]|uniref:DUF3800 domain-containing protein n=1 Tax=Halorussus salilacus TaxID=2953750 RepID=UPI00209EF32C|nr:DUF3800 domain-containing protein [Halorussus salilacus]USZ67128.1 DUF3800 domain-containing protein [Halorussus salilacus]